MFTQIGKKNEYENLYLRWQKNLNFQKLVVGWVFLDISACITKSNSKSLQLTENSVLKRLNSTNEWRKLVSVGIKGFNRFNRFICVSTNLSMYLYKWMAPNGFSMHSAIISCRCRVPKSYIHRMIMSLLQCLVTLECDYNYNHWNRI